MRREQLLEPARLWGAVGIGKHDEITVREGDADVSRGVRQETGGVLVENRAWKCRGHHAAGLPFLRGIDDDDLEVLKGLCRDRRETRADRFVRVVRGQNDR